MCWRPEGSGGAGPSASLPLLNDAPASPASRTPRIRPGGAPNAAHAVFQQTALRADGELSSVAIRSPIPRVDLFVARVETVTLSAALADLAPDERDRADRMTFLPRRAEFVSGRALLRRVLARRLAVSPSDVPLEASPAGKPTLPSKTGLHVSVAHSAGSILVGVAETPVGVDLEKLRPIDSAREISRRFFSRSELEALDRAPENLRLGLFFTIWTRKEAVAKARGTGLSGFSGFSAYPKIDRPGDGQVESFRIDTGFEAAVATNRDSPSL